jgi:hypothetical protein
MANLSTFLAAAGGVGEDQHTARMLLVMVSAIPVLLSFIGLLFRYVFNRKPKNLIPDFGRHIEPNGVEKPAVKENAVEAEGGR